MSGLRIERRFTDDLDGGLDSVYATAEWERRTTRIANPDGTVVFEGTGEIPTTWSQVAGDIMVSKYFRRAGVPGTESGGEESAKQVFSRLVSCWRHWGEQYGYFASSKDAQAFEDELAYMLQHQIAAPNSPQWFNTGLAHSYGVSGPAQGHHYVDPDTGELTEATDAYSRPQPHACFIQSVRDDLVNPGGIMDLWIREARIFKYGSGCTAGDARIYVAGTGFMPIRDLFQQLASAGREVRDFDGKGRYIDVGGDGLHTLSVDEETGTYRQDRIELVWQYDVDADDKVVVRLDRGTRVTVSAWHPFLVWDGSEVVERRADQLRRGDAVVGPNSTALDALPEIPAYVAYETSCHGTTEHHRIDVDTDVAWLVGYFLGDGSLGRHVARTTNRYGHTYEYDRLRLRFHDETVELLDRVRSIVERVFGETATVQRDGRGSRGMTVTYTGRKVTGFFDTLVAPGRKSHCLRMPAFVWEGGRDIALAFLGGLVDSDGHVSEGRATYSTATKEFARDVAVLASLHGIGGGNTADRNVTTVTVLHRSTPATGRQELARFVFHPVRRERLLAYEPVHERKFCMPLSDEIVSQLVGEPERAADWLGHEIGASTFHLGRLRYEGLVNPTKLERMLALMEPGTLVDDLARIAGSLEFVTSVDKCTDDPDFYDLTVAEHSNYLAGETGLVAIHNTGSNFSRIRGEGEPLSGGGTSSGLMSFLKVGDRAAGAIKCLHADTEIVTDSGVVPIAEVRAGSNVMTRFGWRRVSARHDNGERPLLKLTTSLGDELRCTPEHRFWVRGADGEGWREAGDLRSDDHILVDASAPSAGRLQPLVSPGPGHHNEIAYELPDHLDDAVALWLGWIWGDGSITTRESTNFIAVQLGDSDPDLRSRFESLTRCLFGEHAHLFESRHHDKSDSSGSVRFCSTQVIRWLEANGLSKGRAGELRIPSLVKSSPPAVREAFLAGLFEADGHIENGYCVLSSVSRDLVLDVHRELMTLGIPSKIDAEVDRPGAYGRKTIHRVRVVGGEGMRRFAKRVGFVSERKARGLAAAVERKSASTFETQWIIPHVEAELTRLWETARPALRRALSPYCRTRKPRSMSLLRARALVARFPEELGDTVLGRFCEGDDLYVRATVTEIEPGPTCDLTVEDVHEYLVHGLVTHNSGGTTRRAAKMVCLDLDHPDIEKFIDWKADEERKVAALVAAGYPSDFEGEAYSTVSGQNANNSVRVPDTFFRKLDEDGEWELIGRYDGKVLRRVRAVDLWERINRAAWTSADPGLQYDTTINDWHTCPADGRINASNPCSEYLFLDDSACNLASVNLVKFLNADGSFDVAGYRHAIRLWTTVLEISVLMAAYPSEEIARRSYEFRTLGLGYANLGSMLMRLGVAYDSDIGRAICGALTAILTGEAYAQSARIAAELGPFPGFERNREHMLRVIRNHRRASYNADETEYEELSVIPVGIDAKVCPPDLLGAARASWDEALALGEQHGYRNAQVSVLAPTGTIGLLMDCDTTGVEPDFALVKFKKLAGGGYWKIANQGIEPALHRLGYTDGEITRIMAHVLGTNRLDHEIVNRTLLSGKGFTEEELDAVEAALPGSFDLRGALAPWVLGRDAIERLGFDPDDPALDLPASLGFSEETIESASKHCCGHQTVEGAPGLDPAHLPVFDCANTCGDGERFISVDGHIEMMAASQPFLSGAISKTINLPHESTEADIAHAYRLGWERGLKAVALYRDGCKLSQPLSSGGSEADDDAGAEEVVQQVQITEAINHTLAWNPFRRPLPAKRYGWTHEARVGGQKIYLRTGEYADGSLGEIFIDVAKEGATLRSIVNSFAIAISKGLQYGVPLEEFVETFAFTRFEPHGMVEGHENVKMATSLIDYVFRVLGIEYLQRHDLAHVKPDEIEGPAPTSQQRLEATRFQATAAEEAAASITIDAEPATTPELPASPAPANGAAPPSNGTATSESVTVTVSESHSVTAHLSSMMGDAPMCSTCGHITVRNGSCYRCLNCGTSMGCS